MRRSSKYMRPAKISDKNILAIFDLQIIPIPTKF